MSGSALSRLLGQISKPQESLQIDSTSGVLDVDFPTIPNTKYIGIGFWHKNKTTAASSATPYQRSNKLGMWIETATGTQTWIHANCSVEDPSTYLFNDNVMLADETTAHPMPLPQFVGDLAFFNGGADSVANIENWVYHFCYYKYDDVNDLRHFGTWARLVNDQNVRFKAFDVWTPQEIRDFANDGTSAHPGSTQASGNVGATEASEMVLSGTITVAKPFYWSYVSTPAQTEDRINYYKNMGVFALDKPPSKGDVLRWSMATKDNLPSDASLYGFYPLVDGGAVTWNDFSGNGNHLTNSSTMAMAVANIEPSPVSVDTTAATIDTLATPTPNSTGCTTTVNIPEASGTLHVYVTTTGSQPAWAIAYYGTHQTVTASGSNAITVTGKASSITYSMDVVYEDIYGNYSNVLSTTFTTTAPATSGTWKLTENSTGGDYTGIVGTYILEYSGGDDTTNFAGSPNRFEVQNWEVGGRATLLTKITGIASLPAGKNITGSRLLLWVDDVSNDPYIDLFRSLQDWIYNEATWINKKTGSFPWNTSGSLGSGSDIASTPLVTFQVVTGAIGGYITISSSALTALALGWYNGSITNNGLAAICNNNAQDAGYSLYVNFVNSLQTDGHRPIFELDWEDVAGAADLAGNAVDVVTAAGALTASINFVGAAIDNVSATGNLSAQIKFNGAASDVASATGSLTTQLKLNAVAIDVVSASGNLTNQILLGGSAVDVVSASGDLSVGSSASLSASAQNVASASGALTAQIKLNATALAQALASAGLTTGINLAGSAQDVVTAAGALSAQIKLNGVAVDTATASGDLSAGANGAIFANAQSVSLATASITTQIKMTGNAAAVALATANLAQTVAQLSGNAISNVSVSGLLGSLVNLNANATDVVTATATLTIQKPLSANSIVNALATGSLITGIKLLADAQSMASAGANLTTDQLVAYLFEFYGLGLSNSPSKFALNPFKANINRRSTYRNLRRIKH